MGRFLKKETICKGKRYSEAFKRKVIQDIISGIYTANQAQKVYNIGGNTTIYKWLAHYGVKSYNDQRGVKMSKKTDKVTIVDLQSRIRYLEQVVSDLMIEKKILEATIDVANKEYGLDLKKNTGKALLSESIEKTIERSRSKD